MKKLVTSFLFLLFATISFCQNPNFIYTQTCFGNQTTLVASSSLADSAIASWKWDLTGTGPYTANGKTIINLFTTTGTFAVKLKITPNFGTPDSITKNVVIDPLPNVNFRVDNLCALKKATYFGLSTINSGTITQSQWDFNNDGTVDFTDTHTTDTVTYTCGVAQIYQTKLICVSDKGCSAFAVKTTQVYPVPSAQFTVSTTCANDSTLFTNTTTNNPSPDYYYWTFGDGNHASTSGNAVHVYGSTGPFGVSVIAVTANGCRDTSAVNTITVHPLPVVSIFANAPPILWNSFYDGTTITLLAGGADTYLWWNNSDTTRSITVSQGGVFTVTGTDANGCKSSADITIDKLPIPDSVGTTSNILTPNGDGINDYLVIANKEAYQSCKISIYNMWNVLVYSQDGYNNDWGGTSNGKKLPDGPYYYIITCDDKPAVKGNINILTK